MGRKSVERERRQAEKKEDFERCKAKILAQVIGNSEPKQLHKVVENGPPRIAPHHARNAADLATPKTLVDGSRFASAMTYCTTRKDHIDQWTWREPRAWTDDEWKVDIAPPLDNFSRLTWGEIDRFSSESGHKMHHSHEVGDLVAEAQHRWIALGFEEFDTVFRFRMSGTRRAWGFVVQAHFHMVWWDRKHSIYPVS